MKCIKKIAIILIILTIVTLSMNVFSFAISNPDAWKPGKMSDKDKKKVGDITGNILANIRTVGIFLSVIMLTIIGLKYILSAADEKANYKENMVPYVAGCFLLAATTTIPSLIYNVMK